MKSPGGVRTTRHAGVALAGVLLTGTLAAGVANAQVDFVTPGPNTNVIGITPNLAHIADFQLKQQQEPSCIVRPGNESYVFCAFNDLRASDLPAVQGDSWMGVAMSNDMGETWFSRLAPGYLGHPNSLGMGFAADPTLVAIPGNSPGLAILNYIASFRNSNDGLLLIQRWVDYPQEDQDFWKPEDAIYIAADGSEGRFIDKPSMHFLPDLVAQQTSNSESISVEDEPAPVLVSTPSGTLLLVYAVFTGNGNNTKILLRKSFNRGVDWTQSEKISEEQNLVTGVSVASIGQDFVITYRRRGDNNEPDAVISAFCSNDGNQRCGKGEVVFELCPFDQQATGSTFRTFSFPWAASDGNRYWVFAADRRFANDASCTPVPQAPGLYSGKPRIVAMSSVNGTDWVGASGSPELPIVIADREPGFQVMPAALGTKGRIDVAWYDTFREEFFGLPSGNNDLLINDYGNGQSRVFRKADVYMTRLSANCSASPLQGCTPTVEDPVRVSRFPIVVDQANPLNQQEAKAHLTNLRLYASGTVAFNGDYISLATEPYRRLASGAWIPNYYPGGAVGTEVPGYSPNQNLHVAWGDNRDVIADFTGSASLAQLPYTPPVNSDANPGGPMVKADENDRPNVDRSGTLAAADEPDDEPTLPPDLYACVANSFDFTHARDANVYSARVEDVPTLAARTPVKPLGTIQRMFPIEIDGISAVSQQNFCLHIVNQPPDSPEVSGLTNGIASFYQLPAVGPISATDAVRLLDVEVPAGSSASRAVFVTTSDATTVINVNAYEGLCPADTGGPFGPFVNSVQLSDGPLFDPVYCESNDCDLVALNETHDITAGILGMQAPVYQAPVYQASPLEAPVYQAPVLEAPVYQAPVYQATGMEAPVYQATGLEAPVFQAGTPIGDADPEDVVVQDTTYIVGGGGNVTTTFSADIGLLGVDTGEVAVQLIAWVANTYSTTLDCLAYPTADQQVISYTQLDSEDLAAVTLPTTFSPDDQDPYRGEVTYTSASGQQVAVTVRIWATGTARDTLYALESELAECMETEGCDPMSPDLGTRSLISFGASAHGCSTEDAVINTLNANQPDCLNNAEEKIEQDRLPPVIDVPASFSIEATGPSGAIVDYVASVTDNSDPNPLLTCDPASGSTFGLGANTVTCYAVDAAGNDAMAAFTITVIDTTAPVLPTLPGLPDIVTEATGPAGAVVSFATPMATDAVDTDPTVVCVPPSGSLFAQGTTTVTCTATDSAGNSASTSFGVIVQDTSAPVLPALADITADATSPAGAIVEFPLIVAADAVDGSVPAACMPASGSLFPIGMTAVTCVAVDSSGNASAPAGFTVTVADLTAPSVSAPTVVTVIASDPSGVDVEYPVDQATSSVTVEGNLDGAVAAVITYEPVVSDAVDTNPQIACSPASGSGFAIGTTAVICTATDADGNTASSSFQITVQDGVPPTIAASDIAVQSLDAVVDLEIDYVSGNVTAVDAVDPDPDIACYIVNPLDSSDRSDDANPRTFTDYGTWTASCTATDESGNSASASFTISVIFPFNIELILPKGRARPGSAIPIDWVYKDPETGEAIDSRFLTPFARWTGPFAATDTTCSGMTDGSGNGDDAGQSNTRYSASSKTWQLSWQTPGMPGHFLLEIRPPGASVPEATACVLLR